jgi:hypothetical protein
MYAHFTTDDDGFLKVKRVSHRHGSIKETWLPTSKCFPIRILSHTTTRKSGKQTLHLCKMQLDQLRNPVVQLKTHKGESYVQTVVSQTSMTDRNEYVGGYVLRQLCPFPRVCWKNYIWDEPSPGIGTRPASNLRCGDVIKASERSSLTQSVETRSIRVLSTRSFMESLVRV